jgi:hypothetical protein
MRTPYQSQVLDHRKNPIQIASAWVGDRLSSRHTGDPIEPDSKNVVDAAVSSCTGGKRQPAVAERCSIIPYPLVAQSPQFHLNLCH